MNLNEIWILRINSNVEEALRQHMLMQSSFSSFDIKNQISFLALKSSLNRAKRQLKISKQTLSEIEDQFSLENLENNEHYQFEKGIHLFVESDYSNAIDRFLRSSQVSERNKDLVLQTASLMNFLLCLENINIDYRKTLEQVEKLVGDLSGHQLTLNGVTQQLKAFKLRQLVKNNNIKEALSASNAQVTFGQADYYRLWLEQLPFTLSFQTLQQEHIQLALAQPYFVFKGFRLRTIKGIVHPDDEKDTRSMDIVERVYLWTWRLITGIHGFEIDNLVSLLENILTAQTTANLSVEESLLISNALMWLGLWDPNSERTIKSLVHSIKKGGAEDFILFDYENILLHWIYAIRSGNLPEENQFRLLLESHEGRNEDQTYLNLIYRGLKEFKFESQKNNSHANLEQQWPRQIWTLFNRLSHLLNYKFHQANSNELTVDLTTYEVRSAKHASRSEILTKALQMISQCDLISFDDFMKTVFGINYYDQMVHAAKIHNVLAKIKKILPKGLSLITKNQKIIIEGNRSVIKLIESVYDEVGLVHNSNWKQLLDDSKTYAIYRKSLNQQREALVSDLMSLHSYYSREQLQRILQLPKTTVLRRIEKELKSGLISKKGFGKKCLYFKVSQESNSRML